MTHFEIERKFLIRMPTEQAFAAMTDREDIVMEQTYLVQTEAGVTRRVRRWQTADGVRYIVTEKKPVNFLTREETEYDVDEAAYRDLLSQADPGRKPIQKTRYRFRYAGQTFELDVYAFDDSLATLEIELADEKTPVTLPPYLTVVKEVTADKRYYNASLARTGAFPEA